MMTQGGDQQMISPVCVIIPAYNAESTVARAVSSALAQPEVGEVVVVDDCSNDLTASEATRAGAGSPRLKLTRLERNQGPSAARNLAIELSHSPLVAILDSDDFLMPNRFRHILSRQDWDLVADNILFLPEGNLDPPPASASQKLSRWRSLDFCEFVAGNIPKPAKPRGELGFLKPVMRRATIEKMALRYAEDVRLGEDYLFYAAALAKGARFLLTERCGYVAIERPGSLSGAHHTEDLRRLLAGDARLLASLRPGTKEAALVARHARSVRAKYDHRQFLDEKRISGLLPAIATMLTRPVDLAGVLQAVLRDKARGRASEIGAAPRLLFEEREFVGSRRAGAEDVR